MSHQGSPNLYRNSYREAKEICHFLFPWNRKWQPTPVFSPGKSRGQRSLAGYSPWGCERLGRGWVTNVHAQGSKHHPKRKPSVVSHHPLTEPALHSHLPRSAQPVCDSFQPTRPGGSSFPDHPTTQIQNKSVAKRGWKILRKVHDRRKSSKVTRRIALTSSYSATPMSSRWEREPRMEAWASGGNESIVLLTLHRCTLPKGSFQLGSPGEVQLHALWTKHTQTKVVQEAKNKGTGTDVADRWKRDRTQLQVWCVKGRAGASEHCMMREIPHQAKTLSLHSQGIIVVCIYASQHSSCFYKAEIIQDTGRNRWKHNIWLLEQSANRQSCKMPRPHI